MCTFVILTAGDRNGEAADVGGVGSGAAAPPGRPTARRAQRQQSAQVARFAFPDDFP